AQLTSDAKMNVLLSGETNSGKTTIIRMLMNLLRATKMEKIILLQDSPEIDPPETDIVLMLLNTIKREKNPVTFQVLLEETLRMSPNRVWLGEFRGVEAATLIEGFLAGATGGLATGHASSPENMMLRLVIIMLRAGFNLSESMILNI